MSSPESDAVFESIRAQSRRDADERMAQVDVRAEEHRALAARVQAALTTGGESAPDGLSDPDEPSWRGAPEWTVEIEGDDDDEVQGWLR